MWIVAIAWIYVVGLMAVTETSIVAGVMTFIGYCVIPLSILFYLTGGRRRQARREAVARANAAAHGAPAENDKLPETVRTEGGANRPGTGSSDN